MKTVYLLKMALLILICIVFSSQVVVSQVEPSFILKHEDANGYIGGLSFSHDNSKLITTGGQHAIMWNLQSGEKVLTFPEYSGYNAIDFSLDDKKIVTSHVKHANVAIWDVQSGNEIKTIQGEIDLPPPSWYTAVTFTTDGLKVLAGDSDGGLYVIDIYQEKVIQKFKSLGSYVSNIQCFPDGKWIFASLSIVSLETGEIIKKIDKSCPTLSSDVKKMYAYIYDLVGVHEQYTPIVFDTITFEMVKQYSPIPYSQNIVTSPNGKIIAIPGRRKDGPFLGENAHIISFETGEKLRTFNIDKNPTQVFDQVKFSRDGKLIACVKKDTVYLYDISNLYSAIPQSVNLKQ